MIRVNLKRYSCDFHIHSCLSPCAEITMTPATVAELLKERGVDWISITDHNTAGNVRAFSEVLGRSGIKVIPGIEVHTVEDVHVLGFFPDIDTAESYSQWLYSKIPEIHVDPDIFGYQLYIDENDEFIGMEEKWLGQPTSLKIRDVAASIRDSNGIFTFAHIERRMGIIYQLGFIPVLSMPTIIEVAFKNTVSHIPEIADLAMIHSSDAHSPEMLGPRMEIFAQTRNLSEFKNTIEHHRNERVKILWD